MEIYYAIVNILDYLAKHEDINKSEHKKLLKICYDLLPYLEGKEIDNIAAIADANDCGKCNDLETIIIRLRELYKNGERI